MSTKNIRIFIDAPLKENALISVEKIQAHYLTNVMRMKEGAYLSVFNGREGEWKARIESVSKKECLLKITQLLNAQPEEDHRGLIFPPIRPSRLEFMIEKASELGVTDFYPILTTHTSVKKLNLERLSKISIEACEQSERLTIPRFHPLASLSTLLSGWEEKNSIYAGMERTQSTPRISLKEREGGYAALVGPEGGFSPAEFTLLAQCPFIQPVSLGNRILRTETAALALLVLGCSIS